MDPSNRKDTNLEYMIWEVQVGGAQEHQGAVVDGGCIGYGVDPTLGTAQNFLPPGVNQVVFNGDSNFFSAAPLFCEENKFLLSLSFFFLRLANLLVLFIRTLLILVTVILSFFAWDTADIILY